LTYYLRRKMNSLEKTMNGNLAFQGVSLKLYLPNHSFKLLFRRYGFQDTEKVEKERTSATI